MCAATVCKGVYAQVIDDVQVIGVCEQMFDILYIMIILLFDIYICNIRTKVQRNRVGSARHFGGGRMV